MPVRTVTGIIATALVGLAVWQLETARSGLSITDLEVGTTPATVYRQPDATGPAVIIAHGFAGSRQLMEAFALSLARSGYIAVSFDFEGHGRNPVPMSGDVTRVEGTTVKLMAETERVIDTALTLPGVTGEVALLGHSMASDIVVRQTIADGRVATVIGISMFSEAVTATEPARLLMVTGAWEPGLRAAALDALHLVDPEAGEDDTASDPDTETLRRAAVAPNVEHVGVLYSRASLRETRDWLDATFGRTSSGEIKTTGPWIMLLLFGLMLLAWPLAALLPKQDRRPARPNRTTFLAATVGPALLTPLALYPFATDFLPVLVADYLALHLLVYGALSLIVLILRGVRPGPVAPVAALTLVLFGIGVFGLAIDRYAASFMPHLDRLPVILAIAIGAVPFMLADAMLTEAGRAPLWRRVFARLVFFVSLGLAVALDFEELFFLIMILPIIILFFLVFGLMGAWVGRRCGSATAPGLALGLILAWSLGVTFPMFAP